MRLPLVIAALGLSGVTASPAAGQISGRPVPELAYLDSTMSEFMNDNGITAGVLGLMKDGRIVYLRGFGLDYLNLPLPENTPFRIASCTKPITAAAVQNLITQGEFSKDDIAFDTGQAGGGVLPVNPWPFISDVRIWEITVDDLLRHRAGWSRSLAGDWTYREIDIADNMDVASPPGRSRTLRWILGKSVQFDPGFVYEYSNVGYLALGMIVEHVTGQDHIDYLRQSILAPNMWVPSTDFFMGGTFREWQSPREPLYLSSGSDANVFESYGPLIVPRPYGSWHHEARTGQGAVVASPAAMLEFAERYRVGITPDIGKPLSVAPLSQNEGHNGSLDGVNTYVYQRTDGVNVFIAFNKRGDPHYAESFKNAIKPYLDGSNIDIPRTSDGFWTTPNDGNGGVGGYDRPFGNFTTAMNYVVDGSKIRLKPGTSNWTGTIDRKLLIDAPLGAATIGQQ